MLTPIDIRNQEFDGKMRGYDRQQVDDFLREIASHLEDMTKENKDLQDELDWAVKRLDNFEDMQESLNKSIIVAQDAADQLKENSSKEADVILTNAQNKADQILREAINEAKIIKNETDELRKQSRSFRQRLQIMIESQLELLENQQWDEVLKDKEMEDSSLSHLASLADSSNEVLEDQAQEAQEIQITYDEEEELMDDDAGETLESEASLQYRSDPYQYQLSEASDEMIDEETE